MTVNPDLFRASSDPESWKLLAAAINAEFAGVDMEAARRKPGETLLERDAEAERSKAIEPARSALQTMANQQWGGYRMHYTLGQLDTQVLILLAERRHIGWPDIFNAKATFGTPQDIVDIYQGAVKFGSTPNLNHALSSAAKPMNLVNGLRHEGNIATTQQLFKMGADAAHDNGGALFYAVVEAGRADIGRLFGKYGQNGILNLETWAQTARQARKFKVLEDIRKIQWEFGRFHVVDNNTIAEVKPLPDNTGNMKLVFNFAARRVTEILELTNPRQNVVKDYSFDDYGADALQLARDKLVDMGAEPVVLEVMRSKASITRPAARGLSDKP